MKNGGGGGGGVCVCVGGGGCHMFIPQNKKSSSKHRCDMVQLNMAFSSIGCIKVRIPEEKKTQKAGYAV